MSSLIWFLLPIAALSGWMSARKYYFNQKSLTSPDMSHYYKGLNHLLNEQPDKAMDVFVSILEVDNETVELHLALGNMFRRRGEVDRAIMLHQNLIARPTLSKEQKDKALLELGQDFFKAGLLDRAERLFEEVSDSKICAIDALSYLKDVYQQEREWVKAIEVAQRLEKLQGKTLVGEIAQFYCELAEQSYYNAARTQAARWLKKAMTNDKECIRALLLRGRMDMDLENYGSAAKTFSTILQIDPDFAPLILSDLADCYSHLQKGKRQIPLVLVESLGKKIGSSGVLALSHLISRQESSVDAHIFLRQQLNVRPSIKLLREYLQYLPSDSVVDKGNSQLVSEVITSLADESLDYCCNQCGYGSKNLYWQCPSCKSWSSVKPV